MEENTQPENSEPLQPLQSIGQKPLHYFNLMKKVVKKNFYALRFFERDIIINDILQEHPFTREFNDFIKKETDRMFLDSELKENCKYSWGYSKRYNY